MSCSIFLFGLPIDLEPIRFELSFSENGLIQSQCKDFCSNHFWFDKHIVNQVIVDIYWRIDCIFGEGDKNEATISSAMDLKW